MAVAVVLMAVLMVGVFAAIGLLLSPMLLSGEETCLGTVIDGHHFSSEDFWGTTMTSVTTDRDVTAALLGSHSIRVGDSVLVEWHHNGRGEGTLVLRPPGYEMSDGRTCR